MFALVLGVLAVPNSFACCGTKRLSPEEAAAIEAQIKELIQKVFSIHHNLCLASTHFPVELVSTGHSTLPDSEPLTLYSALPLDLVLFIMRPTLFLLSLLSLLAALAVHGGPHLAT
ncbi:hypothetical protein FRB91_002823 [Serendipita sp. 411]|nr:hypothetical protein FRB91_002823 [Serendipita sp. 411]